MNENSQKITGEWVPLHMFPTSMPKFKAVCPSGQPSEWDEHTDRHTHDVKSITRHVRDVGCNNDYDLFANFSMAHLHLLMPDKS